MILILEVTVLMLFSVLKVLEDRLGPGRGTFIAKSVARNLITHERIKFTLGHHVFTKYRTLNKTVDEELRKNHYC